MSKAKKRPIIRSDSEDSDGSENLEQEVMALGTGSTAIKRPKMSSPAAQSSGSGSSSESGSDNEWTMDGKSDKKNKMSIAKRGRGIGRKMIVARKPSSESSSDEDEESGEEEFKQGIGGMLSSSGAGLSSSSDSESSSGESVQFYDGLDDDFVGDEEDRKKLDQMTEAEREQEMFKRYEKRQVLKTRFDIEQRLRKERKAEKKRSKAKEKQRRPTRDTRVRQTDKNKSKAMDELKAKRSADKMRKAEAEKQLQKEPLVLKASDVFSSGSDEESSSGTESSSSNVDSEDESGGKSLSALRREGSKYITTLEQLNKIKLSRYRLEKWVHMPFFKDTVMGCYVRIGIGAHDGKMVYRICKIVNVQEGPKVYTLGSTKTNKTLRLQHASQERQFRMEYVSNSQFSDTEFNKWLQELDSQELKPPSLDMVSKKAKQIEAAKNFSMKDEDIERIIREKEKFRKNPRNYAMTKNRLIREKELAEVEGDQDRVGALSTKIEEIEERAEELDKQRNKGLSAISYINERNRQRNVIRAEQALKEELAAADKDVDDPFTRRKCQPTLVTLAFREGGTQNAAELLQQLSQSKSSHEKEQAVLSEQEEKVPVEQAGPTSSNGQSTSIPTSSNNVEDLFSAHDFDIHIDLPSGPEVTSTMKTVPKPVSVEKADGPRRSLNLSDYKKRRGLI